MIRPPAWLSRVVSRFADFADRLPPVQHHYPCVPGTKGIEWIEDTVVGDRLIFHPKDMPSYRQYFTWRGERLAAFADGNRVDIVRAADLEPRSLPGVWCDDWRVEL